jgi:hypothetical protein
MPTKYPIALVHAASALILAGCAHSATATSSPQTSAAPSARPDAPTEPGPTRTPAAPNATATGTSATAGSSFAWPSGVVARVTEIEKQDTNGQIEVLAQRYRRRTQAAPEGLWITDDQVEVGSETTDEMTRAIFGSFGGLEQAARAQDPHRNADPLRVRTQVRPALVRSGAARPRAR